MRLEDQNLFPFTHRTGNLTPGKQYARPGPLHVCIGSHRFCRSLRCLFWLPPWCQPFFWPLSVVCWQTGESQNHDGGDWTLPPEPSRCLPTLLVGHGHDLPVLCATLILLSILGAFETPVAQACLPLLLQGESLVRGNAAVNQVSAVSSLAGPFLGSLAYSSLGLQPVLAVSGVCFLLTALLECFCSFLLLPIPQLATQEYGPLSSRIFKVVSTSSAESSPCCSVSYS